MIKVLLRLLPLVIVNVFTTVIALARTIVLSHMLGAYEFGFASALSAANATFEQITDMAIYRFVFTTKPSVYAEALAGAHAVSILRGLCVACLMLAASPGLSCVLSQCEDWSSFAWLAPCILINSFEHFEIRVAERDYRYWRQTIAIFVSHGCGLIAMVVLASKLQSHDALIAYLLVQAFVYVSATHVLAKQPYRVNCRTDFARKAFAFGKPLMLNGIGLAVIAQGDRWIVGTLLGLPFLGIYSVVTLAALTPLNGLFKITGAITLAGMHNANTGTSSYWARLKLYSRTAPALASLYALCLIAFLDLLLPKVFGARYAISNLSAVLVSLIAFLRIVRVEPRTSLLLHTHSTRRLAFANQAPALGLLVMGVFAMMHSKLEWILSGALVGEAAGLASAAWATRQLLKCAEYDNAISLLKALIAVLVPSLWILNTSGLYAHIAICVAFMMFVCLDAGLSLPSFYRRGYLR